jgi:hypothetical protein
MSSTRLEVFTDDPNAAPRISRTIPAALYGIVHATPFRTFCDKLDGLLDQLDAEQRRRRKRFWWMYRSIYIWFLYFVVFAPIFFTKVSDSFPIVPLLVSLCICVIQLCTVWGFTERRAGVKTDAEVMREIRLECEEMTNRTPYASFQVVVKSVAIVARGWWLKMSTVDHIAVSISSAATATGDAATAVSVVKADTRNSKVDVAADHQEPVIYAQAVSNGGYQQCATGNDLDLV